jgi:hypothetical protein
VTGAFPREPHGADDASVGERAPVEVAAVGVDALLYEAEEDHGRLGAEEGDQRDKLGDAGEHRDEHDHQLGAERVLHQRAGLMPRATFA